MENKNKSQSTCHFLPYRLTSIVGLFGDKVLNFGEQIDVLFVLVVRGELDERLAELCVEAALFQIAQEEQIMQLLKRGKIQV